MAWYVGNTPSVVHDKPLQHGGTRMGLLSTREGYAAGAYGGLFGDEVKVTNANDTGTGSLRAACAFTYPKWITFSNTQASIRQQSLCDIVTGNTTIDGRGTTPGDATAGTGFYIENYGFRCKGSNHIIHNLTIDFSQWWEGWNIYGAGNGPQPIQGGGTQWQGNWSSSTAYVVNDRVYSGGVVYLAIAAGTNHTPSSSPTFWALADAPSTRGNWSSATAYAVGDRVDHAGAVGPAVWIAIAAGTNHQPDISPTFWTQAAGAVNGEVYISSGPTQFRNTFWYDHITFAGTHYGDGTPPKSGTLWDFMDGGIAFGNRESYITISNCKFVDMNKAAIFGFGSTSANSWGDWSTMHHNYLLRGIQRQPLIRFSHVHIYASYFSETGIPGQTRGQHIDADDGTEVIYEGNLAESSQAQANSFAFSRFEAGGGGFTAGRIKGFSLGNVVLGNVTLDPDGAVDGGTVTFSPSYSYTLPDLSTTTAQNAFRALMQSATGHQ